MKEILKIEREMIVDSHSQSPLGGRVTGERITVCLGDEEIYSQYRELQYGNVPGTKTFVNEFLDRFTLNHASQKITRNACNIICNGGYLFYFISKRRLQSLNFKQKFFHFLLKHIFMSGKTATIEQVKCLLMDYQEK